MITRLDLISWSKWVQTAWHGGHMVGCVPARQGTPAGTTVVMQPAYSTRCRLLQLDRLGLAWASVWWCVCVCVCRMALACNQWVSIATWRAGRKPTRLCSNRGVRALRGAAGCCYYFSIMSVLLLGRGVCMLRGSFCAQRDHVYVQCSICIGAGVLTQGVQVCACV